MTGFGDGIVTAAVTSSLAAVPYLPVSILEQDQLVRAALAVIAPGQATPLPDDVIRAGVNASLQATPNLPVTFGERWRVVSAAANRASALHRAATTEPIPAAAVPAAGLSEEQLTGIEAHTAELVEAMDGSESPVWSTMVNHLIWLGEEVRRHRPTSPATTPASEEGQTLS